MFFFLFCSVAFLVKHSLTWCFPGSLARQIYYYDNCSKHAELESSLLINRIQIMRRGRLSDWFDFTFKMCPIQWNIGLSDAVRFSRIWSCFLHPINGFDCVTCTVRQYFLLSPYQIILSIRFLLPCSLVTLYDFKRRHRLNLWAIPLAAYVNCMPFVFLCSVLQKAQINSSNFVFLFLFVKDSKIFTQSEYWPKN